MAATKKTDNHFLADKIMMRIKHSSWPKNGRKLKVLDCFGGKGVVWGNVEKISGMMVDRIAIDKRIDIMQFHIHGENSRILTEIDLSEFDVIDLDAYGIPADQIDIVIASGFKGVVFVTAIQTMNGVLPHKIIDDLKFPKSIKESAQSLVARRGWEYLKEWLFLKGVTEIIHRSKNRKHYFCFKVNDAA